MKIANVFFFFFLVLTINARAATVFTFGGVGYVSQGQTHVMSPENGYNLSFFGTQDQNNPRAMIDAFAQSTSNPSTFTNLQFLSVGGEDLTVRNYLGATWFEIGHPGLIFSTSSRGFNDFDGWFNILELQWGENNKPSALAVDFYLKENTPNVNWVLGSYRFNSDIPLSQVPEPSSVLLILGAALGLAHRKR